MKTLVPMWLAVGLLQPLLAQPPSPPVPPQAPPANQVVPPSPVAPPAPVPAAIRLVVDAPPVFSALTGAGLKFKLPSQDLRWSKSLESTAPVILTLATKDQSAPALAASQFFASFRAGDLTPSGETYPDPPAVGPETPVKGAIISAMLADEEVGALLAFFKIPPERPQVWIKNEFWKDSGPLKVTGEIPGGRVEITMGGNLEKKGEVWMQISIRWLEDEKAVNGGIPGGRRFIQQQRQIPPSQ